MADHEFRIESKSPAKDDLLFWAIAGHEALARASTYELTVLSKNAYIDAKDILGHAFDVVIEFFDVHGDKHERHCQGHAVRFTRGGQVGRYFRYQIRLRSWFWLLTKRTNSRILQEKPVLGIFDAVLDDSPIKSVEKHTVDNVVGVHPSRRYCVQFQESDYNYLSRLMETEGIYYWFDAHDAPGTMHLSDNSIIAHEKLGAESKLRFVPSSVSEARFNEISEWIDVRRLDSGKYASCDTDYKAIKQPQSIEVFVAESHELADLEVFEYPGGYFTGEEVDAVAKLHLEEFDGRRERHWGFTRWPDVAAGRSFDFEGDRDGLRDGEYVIGGCVFVASHPGYEGSEALEAPQPLSVLLGEAILDDAVNADVMAAFTELLDQHPSLRTGQRGTSAFLITALPIAKTFHPPRLTPRVTMPGPQSAIVCGPQGEELHVDDGRVMVHFHWDRYNDGDGKATCWIRCSQPWAGKGWGGYFTPRIGQEVIVEFMNGDPDRPVITGRVYNDDQPIPYKSPTQSGFKTRSTPGGGPGNYNEIMFEDKMGSELVNIHAERNMSTSVEVDDSTSVGHDQSLSVMNNRTHTVEKNETNTIKVKQVNEIGKRQETHVGAEGQKIVVDGPQESIFKDTQLVQVTKKQTVKALDDRLVDVDGFLRHNVGKNHDVDITGYQTVSVGKDHALLVTGNTKLQSSGERIDLTAGPHTLVADKLSIAAGGSDIEVYAKGDINLTGMNINQTVLGTQKKGITGSSSSVEMGGSLKTSLSFSSENKISAALSNAIGFSCKNEIAVSIVNQISVGIENVGAAKLKNTLFNAENSAMKMFNAPGSPGGLADPVAAGGPMAALGAALGLITGLRLGAAGISAAVLQVQDAVKAQEAIEAERHARQEKAVAELRRLQDLARQAKTPKMDALADKLQALETAVHDKDVEDMGNSPMSTRSFVDTGKAILDGVERTSGH